MAIDKSETTIPVITAVYVFTLVPTAILFLAALITSLLISHYDSLLDQECNSRVRAFLFGCLFLFYTWSLYHFYVLFGWAWKNLIAKLVIFALFVIVMALWIVNGHLTLNVQVSEACFGSVYHDMIIVDLGCLYLFLGYLFVVIAVSLSGGCQSPGEPSYAAKMSLAISQPMVGAIPGAGVKVVNRRGGNRRIGGGGGDDQPASPSAAPLVEMLPPSKESKKNNLPEADAIFLEKQVALLSRREEDQDELDRLEKNILSSDNKTANRGSNPNEAPSPSGFRIHFDPVSQTNNGGGHQADDEDELDSPPRRRLPTTSTSLTTPTAAGGNAAANELPATPRLH